MINVKIEYKSGKQETIKIKLSDYTKTLMSLVSEGRLKSIEII